MGVTGLYAAVQPTLVRGHLRSYPKVAFDAFGFMYTTFAKACPKYKDRDPCGKSLEEFVKKVIRFSRYCHPILVFDGASVPLRLESAKNKRISNACEKVEGRKNLVTQNRSGGFNTIMWSFPAERASKLRQGEEAETANNKTEAFKKYGRALDVEPLDVHKYIKALNAHGIENYVAPYEADAQCAWFALNGMVDAVATGDSDLILYDIPVVLYDMDDFGGCNKFEFNQFASHQRMDGLNKNQFFEACVLAGGDYIKSLTNSTNLEDACKLLKEHKSYQGVLEFLDSVGRRKDDAYRRRIVQTLLLRRHQRVYNTTTQDISHLTPLAEDIGDTDFLGPLMPKEVAQDIAKGLVDPKTKLPFPLEEGDLESFFAPSARHEFDLGTDTKRRDRKENSDRAKTKKQKK